MLWFSVWLVLVVGTLVGAFFLLRRLYRAGKALLVELDHAAQVFGDLADRADALAEAATARHPVQPVHLDDAEPARARVAVARQVKAARAARRAARHEATYARWRALSH